MPNYLGYKFLVWKEQTNVFAQLKLIIATEWEQKRVKVEIGLDSSLERPQIVWNKRESSHDGQKSFKNGDFYQKDSKNLSRLYIMLWNGHFMKEATFAKVVFASLSLFLSLFLSHSHSLSLGFLAFIVPWSISCARGRAEERACVSSGCWCVSCFE